MPLLSRHRRRVDENASRALIEPTEEARSRSLRAEDASISTRRDEIDRQATISASASLIWIRKFLFVPLSRADLSGAKY